MQIILNKDVQKLGYRGDVVSVKMGYFMNYLYPNGIAEMATPSALKLMASRKDRIVMKKQQLMDNAKDVVKKLDGLKIKLTSKVTGKGKLYGAITESDVILAVLEAANVKLEKEFVKMEHIKEVGNYKILVHFGEGLEARLNLKVEAIADKPLKVESKKKSNAKAKPKAKKK